MSIPRFCRHCLRRLEDNERGVCSRADCLTADRKAVGRATFEALDPSCYARSPCGDATTHGGYHFVLKVDMAPIAKAFEHLGREIERIYGTKSAQAMAEHAKLYGGLDLSANAKPIDTSIDMSAAAAGFRFEMGQLVRVRNHGMATFKMIGRVLSGNRTRDGGSCMRRDYDRWIETYEVALPGGVGATFEVDDMIPHRFMVDDRVRVSRLEPFYGCAGRVVDVADSGSIGVLLDPPHEGRSEYFYPDTLSPE